MSDVKDKMAEAAEKEGKKLFAKVSVKGKAYYSHDYKYMADVTTDSVTIYKADDLNNPQNVDLKNQESPSLNGCPTETWPSWPSILLTGKAAAGM